MPTGRPAGGPGPVLLAALLLLAGVIAGLAAPPPDGAGPVPDAVAGERAPERSGERAGGAPEREQPAAGSADIAGAARTPVRRAVVRPVLPRGLLDEDAAARRLALDFAAHPARAAGPQAGPAGRASGARLLVVLGVSRT
ncbi:hypothetical protein [Actinomadura parmotrematis]|uniref:Uncharacterized protein n=1 Tax=Actinomadura parmotrematis TaxID=2864039 RepID=A0ABS7FN17_9ACTN|nr:hypothetical protein [Actinomadura parmotrematis]MBW8481783.1 hypothetical protein [Actinomadura parmotrematis]